MYTIIKHNNWKSGEQIYFALGGDLGCWRLQGGATAGAKNAELGFLVPFLCWRFSERVGFGQREMGFFRIKQEWVGGSSQTVSFKFLSNHLKIITENHQNPIHVYCKSYEIQLTLAKSILTLGYVLFFFFELLSLRSMFKSLINSNSVSYWLTLKFFSLAKSRIWLYLSVCVGGQVYKKNSAVSWPAIIIDGMIFSPDFSATCPFELIVLTILAFLLILS